MIFVIPFIFAVIGLFFLIFGHTSNMPEILYTVAIGSIQWSDIIGVICLIPALRIIIKIMSD